MVERQDATLHLLHLVVFLALREILSTKASTISGTSPHPATDVDGAGIFSGGVNAPCSSVKILCTSTQSSGDGAGQSGKGV
ncbi:hypothetical protein HYQ45_003937 [Verticillium longisporum]|uniref:Secreted protein n=1 Tax=Verticillium longisporum TaxID=100787 RepID=A0A8I2ZVR7_VERLO|nr:hypothetical protein HYQ45_003937 [Verticillium longisporum]